MFDSAGAHLRTLGGRGGGPGEFQDADDLWLDDSLRLWVSDRRARRFSAFDTAGRLIGDWPREGPGFFPTFVGGAADGTLWDAWPSRNSSAPEPRTELARFAGGAYEVAARLPPFREQFWQIVQLRGNAQMTFNFPVPYAARELLAADPSGAVWRSALPAYRLTRLEAGGDSTRVILREHHAIPVTAAERARALERYRAAFTEADTPLDESRIPAQKPAIREIVVDDLGYLWVAPYAANDSAAIAFDVFDADGRFLGAVPTPVTPPSLDPRPVVRGNAMYYVLKDELDVPYVVRLGIQGRE